MGIEVPQPVVIPNLNLQEVTWAQAYCAAAKESGLKVINYPTKNESRRVFLGDVIPSELLAYSQVAVYLLAAVEGFQVEKENIFNTQLSLLASSAERERINTYFGHIDSDKLFVAGFPIKVTELEKYFVPWDKKIKKSVCFLGETRPIKNPSLELEIIKKLRERNYQCFHLSPRGVSISDELKTLGCQVIEGIRGNTYFQTASHFQYVVNTSHSESLYISGIEASIMGAVPIVPSQTHSGFSDWCPPVLMYDYPSADSAVDLIGSVDGLVRPFINYRWYNQNAYFKRIVERVNQCR